MRFRSQRTIMILVLVSILVIVWGWYFLIYPKQDNIENTVWYKDSDNQKVIKITSFVSNEFIRQGYNFINYIDNPMYSNYTSGMQEDGKFKIVGYREWTEKIKDKGDVNLKQKLVIIAGFDDETKMYSIQSQVQSRYNIPHESNQWVEWDAGNAKINVYCSDKQLRKSILDTSNVGNQLDNLIGNFINKIKNSMSLGAF